MVADNSRRALRVRKGGELEAEERELIECSVRSGAEVKRPLLQREAVARSPVRADMSGRMKRRWADELGRDVLEDGRGARAAGYCVWDCELCICVDGRIPVIAGAT